MDIPALGVLVQFYENVDIFGLILVRVLAFILMMPIISNTNIPTVAKMTLAVCLSVVIFLSGAVTTVTYHDSAVGYVLLIVSEFMTGMFMSYVLFFIFNAIYYAGQLIDYQIGLSMMMVLDPMTQAQVPITGNLYYLAVSAMLIASDGLHSFLGAFFYSYRVLPIGVSNIVGNAPITWYVLTLLTEFLVLGVKIALPLVGAILIIDAVLGILVKAAPQINVFVVGMPLKLLGGLLLLLVIMGPTLGIIYNYLFDQAYAALINVIGGLAP